MDPQSYYDDPEWKRLQRRLLIGGVAVVGLMGWFMLRAWPEPAGPSAPEAGDVFLAGPDAPLVVRMTAEDSGETVVTRREVSAFRTRLSELAARCENLAQDDVAVMVERTRHAVREGGRSITYSRTIAELSFQVDLAEDRDCGAAARAVGSGTASRTDSGRDSATNSRTDSGPITRAPSRG
jgi:hypothetical protein